MISLSARIKGAKKWCFTGVGWEFKECFYTTGLYICIHIPHIHISYTYISYTCMSYTYIICMYIIYIYHIHVYHIHVRLRHHSTPLAMYSQVTSSAKSRTQMRLLFLSLACPSPPHFNLPPHPSPSPFSCQNWLFYPRHQSSRFFISLL